MARKSLAESTLQDFAKLNSEKIPPPTQHGSREFTESNSNPPGFSEAKDIYTGERQKVEGGMVPVTVPFQDVVVLSLEQEGK